MASQPSLARLRIGIAGHPTRDSLNVRDVAYVSKTVRDGWESAFPGLWVYAATCEEDDEGDSL